MDICDKVKRKVRKLRFGLHQSIKDLKIICEQENFRKDEPIKKLSKLKRKTESAVKITRWT